MILAKVLRWESGVLILLDSLTTFPSKDVGWGLYEREMRFRYIKKIRSWGYS